MHRYHPDEDDIMIRKYMKRKMDDFAFKDTIKAVREPIIHLLQTDKLKVAKLRVSKGDQERDKFKKLGLAGDTELARITLSFLTGKKAKQFSELTNKQCASMKSVIVSNYTLGIAYDLLEFGDSFNIKSDYRKVKGDIMEAVIQELINKDYVKMKKKLIRFIFVVGLEVYYIKQFLSQCFHPVRLKARRGKGRQTRRNPSKRKSTGNIAKIHYQGSKSDGEGEGKRYDDGYINDRFDQFSNKKKKEKEENKPTKITIEVETFQPDLKDHGFLKKSLRNGRGGRNNRYRDNYSNEAPTSQYENGIKTASKNFKHEEKQIVKKNSEIPKPQVKKENSQPLILEKYLEPLDIAFLNKNGFKYHNFSSKLKDKPSKNNYGELREKVQKLLHEFITQIVLRAQKLEISTLIEGLDELQISVDNYFLRSIPTISVDHDQKYVIVKPHIQNTPIDREIYNQLNYTILYFMAIIIKDATFVNLREIRDKLQQCNLNSRLRELRNFLEKNRSIFDVKKDNINGKGYLVVLTNVLGELFIDRPINLQFDNFYIQNNDKRYPMLRTTPKESRGGDPLSPPLFKKPPPPQVSHENNNNNIDFELLKKRILYGIQVEGLNSTQITFKKLQLFLKVTYVNTKYSLRKIIQVIETNPKTFLYYDNVYISRNFFGEGLINDYSLLNLMDLAIKRHGFLKISQKLINGIKKKLKINPANEQINISSLIKWFKRYSSKYVLSSSDTIVRKPIFILSKIFGYFRSHKKTAIELQHLHSYIENTFNVNFQNYKELKDMLINSGWFICREDGGRFLFFTLKDELYYFNRYELNDLLIENGGGCLNIDQLLELFQKSFSKDEYSRVSRNELIKFLKKNNRFFNIEKIIVSITGPVMLTDTNPLIKRDETNQQKEEQIVKKVVFNKKIGDEMLSKGKKLFRSGKYLESVKILDELALLDPKNDELRIPRRTAYMKLKKYDLALKDSEVIVKAYPNWFMSHYFLAITLVELKRYDRALKELAVSRDLTDNMKEMIAIDEHIKKIKIKMNQKK